MSKKKSVTKAKLEKQKAKLKRIAEKLSAILAKQKPEWN